MKKIAAILTALTLALMLSLVPALAEATEAPAVEATETPAEEVPAEEAPAEEAPAEEAPAEEVPAEEEAAEEEAEEEESWADEAFGDLKGMHWYTAAILAVLLVMGLIMCSRKGTSWSAKRLAYAAMCIAIAFVLSCIKLFHMPQGGSVTPAAMLPLILFALACGPAQGLVVGCAFGLLQMVEDFYMVHPIQILVDYPMAYAALALACLVNVLPIKNDRVKLPVAVLLGYLGRYIMATISGAVFFAEYAGEQNAWIYSLGYNISYLGVEALIAMAISLIPGVAYLLKTMRKKV